jgi:hypothetical protein
VRRVPSGLAFGDLLREEFRCGTALGKEQDVVLDTPNYLAVESGRPKRGKQQPIGAVDDDTEAWSVSPVRRELWRVLV